MKHLNVSLNVDLLAGFNVLEEFVQFYMDGYMLPTTAKVFLRWDEGKALHANALLGDKRADNSFGEANAEFLAQSGDRYSNSKVLGKLGVDVAGFKRSVSVLVEHSHDFKTLGRFEVTIGIDENRRISMAMSAMPRNKREATQIRTARATILSEEFGNFDFQFDQDLWKGIFVISTPRGLHKISYEINEKQLELRGYDILLQLETPYLERGRAQLKVSS